MRAERTGKPKIERRTRENLRADEAEFVKRLILRRLPVYPELVYAASDLKYRERWKMQKQISLLAERIEECLLNLGGEELTEKLKDLVHRYNSAREIKIQNVAKTIGKDRLTPAEIPTWGIAPKIFLYEGEKGYLEICWGQGRPAERIILRGRKKGRTTKKVG